MRTSGWLLAVALACLAAGAAPAHAKDDVGDILNALRDADVKTRLDLVRRLGASKNERAAVSLCKIARFSDDASVRIAAAKALADFDADVALPSLKELLTEGGIREVRRHAAIGMSKRPHGLEWVLLQVNSGRTDKLERFLLVSSLGDFPSLDAAGALERIISADPPPAAGEPRVLSGAQELARFIGRNHPPLRSIALRALARHEFGKLELPRIAVDVLEHAEDVETVLAALDVCDGVLDREIRSVLPGLMQRGDRRITAAAEIVSKRLDWMDAVERFNAQKKADEKARREGYAPSNPTSAPPPPPVPSMRAKVDVVFICDASGSMGGLGKVAGVHGGARASQEELDTNVSYRHGFVSMQDTMREAWDPPSIYFPPLFDASVLENVRWRQPAVGVDTEGMEVGVVLRAVLDKFEWRRGAERRVVVVSDTYVGDPVDACRTVRVHHAADGLTLDVGYVGYGIGRNRKSWENLFVAAGGVLPPKERKK